MLGCWTELACAEGHTGNQTEARKVLKKATEEWGEVRRERLWGQGTLIMTNVGVGESEEALRLLEVAYARTFERVDDDKGETSIHYGGMGSFRI